MSKTVNLRAADLNSGETAQLRDLTFTPAGGSATTVKALLTAAVTIPPSPDVTIANTDGGSASGTVTVLTAAAVDAANKHKINTTTKSITIPAPVTIPGIQVGLELISPSSYVTVLSNVSVDAGNGHRLLFKYCSLYNPTALTYLTVITGIRFQDGYLQVKKQTILCETNGTASWENAVQFASFAD